MKIIGLCGEKGSGKDTICELLSKIYNVKRFAFADPLKDALKDLFLWDDSNFSREKKKLMMMIGVFLLDKCVKY